jgi:2-oxoglutarate ferredoxin oxidoreductase subunit alpha
MGEAMTDVADAPAGRDVERVVIRFAGDSGDGMQLTGDRFTSASALFGNDLATLPEFPAEIRAPQGTLAGVSAFQVQISSERISTPGDEPTVLVAMNPAALKSDLDRLAAGGMIIVNEDAFEERNLEKAGYVENPLDDGSLDGYTLLKIPMTKLTREVCADLGVKPRDAERSKNFFALGLVSWMYTRPTEPTIDWISEKFAGRELIIAANNAAFKAGHAYGETAELGSHVVSIPPANLDPGTYTSINGNTALSWGLIAASQQSGVPLFLGSYPITPATDILHELAKHKNFGVRTFQAEDEIAAVSSAIGAAYGGSLAVTTTSGPGVALKGEASDLLMAMYGRHGESPMPIVAAYSPAQCFEAAIEAARIALTYMTPVILLSDGYLANGSEPWLLPDVNDLDKIDVSYATEPNHINEDGEPVFYPFMRDDRLTRPWAVPGTEGLMHRVGGLEKADGSGNVSYDPSNHGLMTEIRAQRIAQIEDDIPLTSVEGDADATVAIVGWGSTWGAIRSAVQRLRSDGTKMAHIHLTHLNPFPRDLGEVLSRFDHVLVPELNMGQLVKMLRSDFLIDAKSINKVMGQPFTAGELEREILAQLEGSEV